MRTCNLCKIDIQPPRIKYCDTCKRIIKKKEENKRVKLIHKVSAWKSAMKQEFSSLRK